MQTRTDILNDESGDLNCRNGDFLIGNSNDQHVEDILTANPGEYKQYPLLGVGIHDTKNGSIDGSVKNRIRTNLGADGYSLLTLQQNPDDGSIDFNYDNK